METPEHLLQLLDDEPASINVEEALTRVRTTDPPHLPRRIWLWPVAVCASLASILIAQQALSHFEVRRVLPLRYPAGPLPMELMLPNVFPLFPANQVKSVRVANASQASAHASYPARLLKSPLLPYVPTIRVEQYPAVERTLDRAKIEGALASRHAPPVAFPPSLDGGTVALRFNGPAIVSHYGRCARLVGPWDACAFLIQQKPPSLELPPGVDLGDFTEFSLRLIGLSPTDARALRGFPVAPSLFLPFDESMLDVTTVTLRSGPGTLVRYKTAPNGQAFTLQWTDAGQLFTLTGRDTAHAAAIANSLEP